MNTYNLCVFCGKLMGIWVYDKEGDVMRTCYICGVRYYDLEGIMAISISLDGKGFHYVEIPSGVLLVMYEVAL